MTNIPRAVLSERFQAHMKDRRLISAVFLTFRFDPAFFEQEVLPVFLDVPLSHVSTIRLLQLEDAIKLMVDEIAVYYDRGALEAVGQSAKLDFRRIPVTWKTGYFHPKNLLALVEDAEPDEEGNHRRHLIVAAMSANLTRAGWWENVEACHIEEVSEGEKCGFRDDVRELLAQVRRAAPNEDHAALDQIRRFLRGVEGRKNRISGGVFHSRLYTGAESVPDFLSQTLGGDLDELNLEVISPYFDNTASSKPLKELIDRFRPREVRVFLPRNHGGEALCEKTYYDAVGGLPNTSWGKLPSDLLRRGKAEAVADRFVHAKVYRFFHPHRRYEALLVGSVNLTNAAHGRGGNLEAAFLVESQLERVTDWWLTTDRQTPLAFQSAAMDSGATAGRALALTIRFDWDLRGVKVFWDADEVSPVIRIDAQGAPLFRIEPIQARKWTDLDAEKAADLATILRSTSFVTALVDDEEPVIILVQEAGMAHKPSLLQTLSAADILRYWSLLTPEQRADFLQDRLAEIPGALQELGLDRTPPLAASQESLFDKFAGAFHAFGCLERSVREALGKGREKEAVYRLFGAKYDSLPRLIDRILNEEKDGDHVLQYVIVLCAKQLVDGLEREHPEFCPHHKRDLRKLTKRFEAIADLRERFSFGSREDRDAFFQWFDHWFVTRAEADGEAA